MRICADPDEGQSDNDRKYGEPSGTFFPGGPGDKRLSGNISAENHQGNPDIECEQRSKRVESLSVSIDRRREHVSALESATYDVEYHQQDCKRSCHSPH